MSQRIVLVGAPGTNKTELVYKIDQQWPHLTRQKPIDGGRDVALGMMADYRTELQIALDRMWFTELTELSIAKHSLIDSVAYSTLKYLQAYDTNQSETSLYNALSTLNMIICLIRDTFRYDLIAHIPNTDEERIGSALLDVIETFDLPYIELSGNLEEDAKELIELIGKDHG